MFPNLPKSRFGLALQEDRRSRTSIARRPSWIGRMRPILERLWRDVLKKHEIARVTGPAYCPVVGKIPWRSHRPD